MNDKRYIWSTPTIWYLWLVIVVAMCTPGCSSCTISVHLHCIKEDICFFFLCSSIFTEPILTMGSIESITWDDEWTTVTADGSRAAQFEHTILITGTGAEVLTKC